MLFSLVVPINPNCVDTRIQQETAPFEKPSAFDFIGNVWDIIVNVATLGVGTRCGTPVAVSFTIALFNLMSLSILGIGVAFFVRGSS